MNKEEASAVLDDMKVKIDIPKSAVTQHKRNEALDMAISALSEELSEDGTLTVHVSDGSKVKRVFVMGDNIFGGLYYPDSAFDGMTYKDVVKAVFPNAVVIVNDLNGTVRVVFSDEVWDSPYQKGGEDKE